MEKPPKLETETEPTAESLSRKKKFEVLLSIFGTDSAREQFLELCRKYHTARGNSRHPSPLSDSENYISHAQPVYTTPQRAETHNEIMRTIGALGVQAKNLAPLQQEVLLEFASREEVAMAIKEYVLAEQHREEDDEDEERKKTQNMSPTAYFHSLGKGE
jgi:hypothetical protein